MLNEGVLQRALSSLAAKFSIWLVVGSFPILTKKGMSSTCLLHDDKGKLVEHYQKLHLFDANLDDKHAAYTESAIFASGDQIKILETPFGKIGLSICYDLRFPELYKTMGAMGADIFLVPAAFTQVTGEAHWQILLQARAIENQAWLIAAAQCGRHQQNRASYGHSMIIDPWGKIVAKLSDEIGTLCADIDLNYMQAIRKKMPLHQHAKLHSSLK